MSVGLHWSQALKHCECKGDVRCNEFGFTHCAATFSEYARRMLADAEKRSKPPAEPVHESPCRECSSERRGSHHKGCSSLDVLCVVCLNPAGWHEGSKCPQKKKRYRWARPDEVRWWDVKQLTDDELALAAKVGEAKA